MLIVEMMMNMIRVLANLLANKLKKSMEIAPAEGDNREKKDMVVCGGNG